MSTTPMSPTEAPAVDIPETAAALTDGFHLIVDALKLNAVETIYGVVGIPITDLARIAQASGIRYIGFRHEASAGNAAAAAGFLTRRPGVCLTVSAPGFLNGLVALIRTCSPFSNMYFGLGFSAAAAGEAAHRAAIKSPAICLSFIVQPALSAAKDGRS